MGTSGKLTTRGKGDLRKRKQLHSVVENRIVETVSKVAPEIHLGGSSWTFSGSKVPICRGAWTTGSRCYRS